MARDIGSAPPGSGVLEPRPPMPSRCSIRVPNPLAAPSPSEAGKPDDDLARLGDRIAELAAGINAAEAQMMALIADFDRRGGWKDDFGSCAEWLAWRIGIKIGPARERVRAARALENLPQTAGALREGEHLVREGAGADARGHAGERGEAARVRARRLGGEPGADGAHVEEVVARPRS